MIWENMRTLVCSTVWYLILTCFIPSVCLSKYVKHRNITFRFFFYQCAGNLYLNFLMLALGYLKFINFFSALVSLILIPLILCCLREHRAIRRRVSRYIRLFEQLSAGTYGGRLLVKDIALRIKKTAGDLYRNYLKSRLPEILIFCAVMTWIIWFYGWYKLHNAAYGHTDEETHLYWISELIHGNMFPAGMYPHGMHTLVAAITVLTGLNVARVYLMFSVLSTALVFGFSYLMFRKCIGGRYTALVGWVIFVLADVFHTVSFVRFQISFPMEFGLAAAFCMVYAMLHYAQYKKKGDLLLFGLSISWTLMAHFYVTIFCAVICVCFGLVYFVTLIRRKMLPGFLIAGIAGITLACVPYIVGFMAGYQFERSIEWAFGVAGTSASSREDAENEEDMTAGELAEETLQDRNEAMLEAMPPGASKLWMQQETYLTYNYVNGHVTVRALMGADIALFIYALGGLILSKDKERFRRYLFWSVLWEAGAVLACTYYLGLPAIIEVKRMATFLTFLTVPLLCLPFEILRQLLKLLHVKEDWSSRLIFGCVLAELVCLVYTGKVKSGLYYNITISEADMRVCLELVDKHEDHTWTVISPTNDLTLIRYDGYHYEITDLIKELDGGADSVYIPTPFIYAVVEKHPISFADDRREIDHSDIVSAYNVKEIRGEYALKDVEWNMNDGTGIHALDAPYYFQREILMSKLHYWMETVRQVYPNHVTEFYEDEQVCVYQIKQDPYFKLNLAVDYRVLAKESVD